MTPREPAMRQWPEGVPAGFFDVPCGEIDAIAEELALRGVPFRAEHHRPIPGWQLVYQAACGEVSVVWSPFSYGSSLGLLEAWDYDERGDPRGWLSAAAVLNLYPPEGAR